MSEPPSQPPLLPHRPLVLGIAGCSGSGKTTLARELVSQLNASLLSLDFYYRDLSHLTPADRAVQNFDHPDSLELPLLLDHLRELSAGLPVHRPVYDFSTHTRARDATGAPRTELVQPAPVLLVEGILALHDPALRRFFDLSVFVSAPHDVCLARRIHRDVRERDRTESSVRKQFHRLTRPMADRFVLPSAAFASVVVEGTESIDWSVATVLHRLRSTGLLHGRGDHLPATFPT